MLRVQNCYHHSPRVRRYMQSVIKHNETTYIATVATVELVYYGHLGTNKNCPNYQDVQVSLYDNASFGTITKCVDYASALIFKYPDYCFHCYSSYIASYILVSALTSLACDKMLEVLFASFCTLSGPARVSATLCNGRPALSPTTVEGVTMELPGVFNIIILNQ